MCWEKPWGRLCETNRASPGLDTCMTEEFMRAFAFNAGITLHTRIEYGKNAHHQIEAMFKAVARAMREAVSPRDGILSTKGVLA